MSAATLPLKPIEADFTGKLQETVEQRAAIVDVVRRVADKGLANVYFVGAGGSIISSYPAHYVLQARAGVPVFQVQSDELNCQVPRLMGEGSLVILASYTGTTKETIAAAKTAKATGATVLAVAKEGSPLAEAVDVAFKGKSDVFELLVAYAVLEATGDLPDPAAVDAGLQALPKALLSAVEQSEQHLAAVADAYKDAPFTYVLGSGPSYAWAYGFAMCFLQEMQWKQAAGYNSGEFFQGAFEMVDSDSAVILWLGEDATRPMGERARKFLETYAPKHQVIDVKGLDLPGVPDAVRADFSPLVIGALANRLAQHYESLRGHDLETRRYMFKVDY